MVAVDTNVVVRLLTEDDPRQFARARACFAEAEVWIGKTVLIETAWVLRDVYELRPEAILVALENLLALPNVVAEQEALMLRALAMARGGMEFADAVHVLSAEPRSFRSFDRRLVARGKRCGLNVAAV